MSKSISGNDRAVQATNDDATISKLSCVKHGYFNDAFLKCFIRKSVRRSPVIHRGYYARWAAMKSLLDQFLSLQQSVELEKKKNDEGEKEGIESATESSERKDSSSRDYDRFQILSVGAGFDTTFFQLKMEGRAPSKYFEVDFQEVTSKKAAVIASNPEMSQLLGPFSPNDYGGLSSDDFSLISADLRDSNLLEAALKKEGMDFRAPTLVIAECVLIYMDPLASRKLISWAAQALPTSAFVVYEQIRPDDAFGQQMVQNLEIRGCPLVGLRDTPSLDSKIARFVDGGYKRAEALDMDEIYSKHINQKERQRIERLEIFDEFEEWHMMQEHYCISYGVNDERGILNKFGFLQAQDVSVGDMTSQKQDRC